MTTPRTFPTLVPPMAKEPEESTLSEEASASTACSTKPPRHDDPTRYGDWELSGKCVDF